MSHKTYNNKYLFNTIFVLGNEIEDIGTWSAYNDDKLNDEWATLRDAFEALKTKAFETEDVPEEEFEEEEEHV